MKYAIRKLSADFIFEELEQVRKQFVDALTYTMESAEIFFDEKVKDPLDIHISYDFQQKHGDDVIYGFNLREEIFSSFALDKEKYHSSKQLLQIAHQLRELADEIIIRYDPEPEKTMAEIEAQNEKKATDFAKNVNRSYRQVLQDALAEDEALKQENISNRLSPAKSFLQTEYHLKKGKE